MLKYFVHHIYLLISLYLKNLNIYIYYQSYKIEFFLFQFNFKLQNFNAENKESAAK